MAHTVVFTPEAVEQLATIYRYIATTGSPDSAERYTRAIVKYCEGLQIFPYRGVSREDLRPGLRITNYKKRAVIAYDVTVNQVSIFGVFYGGQDHESNLQTDVGD